MADRVFHQGEVIGDRYRLTTQLGKGAFGVVWKAEDLQEDVQGEVAIKILLDKYRQDKKMLGRFVQEAKILDRLEHPNICKPVTWDAKGEDVYLTMEFIDGETLDKKFEGNSKDGSPIPAQGVAWIADKLCSAIGYAHTQSIIHRDLKPKNVMVNHRGQRPFVKVLDFGIAKMLVGSEIDPTTVGRVLGSVLYISPEQVLGKPLDHRVDIFSLGTILFELIALRRAWARDDSGQPLAFHKNVASFARSNSHVSVLRRIAREGRPSACAIRSDLSPQVDEVLHKAMAINPEERFESAEAFAQALRAALTDPLSSGEIAASNDLEEGPTLTMGQPPEIGRIRLPSNAKTGPGLPKFSSSAPSEQGEPLVSTQTLDKEPKAKESSGVITVEAPAPSSDEPSTVRLSEAQPPAPKGLSPGVMGAVLAVAALIAAVGYYLSQG